MSNQRLSPVAPAVLADEAAPLPILTNGHHSGLKQLRTAFAEFRPVAIVIGESQFRPSFLLDRFLAEKQDDVSTVRVTRPGSEEDAAVRDVARAAGFDLQDVSLVSVYSEFINLLSYQKHNNRRTIIAIEEIQPDSAQIFAIALRLAEWETKKRFGLMLILSGPPSLNGILSKPPFDALCAYAGRRIALGPFSLAETREHIFRDVDAAGISDIGRVFEYDAITRIHEICEGVPERVETLCCECIEIADEKGSFPVTANLAIEAGKLLWPEQLTRSPAEAARINGAKAPIGRLIARMHGVVVKEQALNNGHILIGRSPLCDISVGHPLVSRHHALVVRSATGVSLIDLGSTNGTFIGGRQVNQRPLQNGDVISIGDCKISYLESDD